MVTASKTVEPVFDTQQGVKCFYSHSVQTDYGTHPIFVYWDRMILSWCKAAGV
jgi:hypothetical protein